MVKKRLSKHNTAIGLNYQAALRVATGSQDSPTISVKGEHFEADEIVRLANRFGVPVVQKRELAKALKTLNLDENVPSELFEAIALIIAQVDKRIK